MVVCDGHFCVFHWFLLQRTVMCVHTLHAVTGSRFLILEEGFDEDILLGAGFFKVSFSLHIVQVWICYK